MAQAYGLYHGTGTVTNQVSVANLALARSSIMHTGIVRGSGGGTAASVIPAVSGLSVVINTGDWWNSGYFAQSTGGTVTLALAANPSGSIRIDRIVAQIDTVASTASFVVVQGTAGAGAPAINTLGTQLQLSLAQVSVAAGATAATNIVSANIADERPNHIVCGYAAPVVHGIDHHPALGWDPLPLFNLAWPEQMSFGPQGPITGNGVQVVDLGWQSFGSAAAYTVPSGWTLYATSLNSPNGSSITVKHTAGGTYRNFIAFQSSTIGQVALVNPLIVQGGGLLSNSGTGAWGFRGYLVPASGKLTGFCTDLNGTPYTVPAGSWLVVTHIHATATNQLQINGVDVVMPGITAQFQYVGFGGTGVLATGVNLYEINSAYIPGLLTPQLYGPGSVLSVVSAALCTIHGYLWPTTG